MEIHLSSEADDPWILKSSSWWGDQNKAARPACAPSSVEQEHKCLAGSMES
jgi:hypothetical protein